MAKPKVKKPVKPVKSVKRFEPHKIMKLPLPEDPAKGPLTRFMDEHPEAFGPPRYQELDNGHRLPVYQEIDPIPPSSRAVNAVIVEPDPLDGKLGVWYVAAAQRVLTFARQYPQEVNSETFTRSALARVVAKDPGVKLLVALDADTGEIVGHVLAMIEGTIQDKWVFCYQAQVDARGGGVLQQLIDAATPWGKAQGATSLLMATQLDPAFWQRQYGFETARTVMKRPI